jgi:uncharacterized membrane protein YraQ (UPF0718 family)
MAVFSLVILGLILLSALADWKRTWTGLKKGLTMFINILPQFLTVMVLAAVLLYFIPESAIRTYLGERAGVQGIIMGAVIGSVTMLPGFVAYPLCAVLMKQGVSIVVLAVFVTTLMMVGIVTLPLEFKFFGRKAALLRNLFCLIGAIIVALLMGISYAWF